MDPENAEEAKVSPHPFPLTSGSRRTSRLPLLIIAVAVLAGLLAVTVMALYSQIRKQKGQLQEETIHRQSVELRLQETQRDLNSRLEQLNQVQGELRTSLLARNGLQEELTTLRSEHGQLQVRFESTVQNLEFLQKKLQAEEEAVNSLRDRLEQEQESQKLLLSRVEMLMNEKSGLQEKISRLEKGVPDNLEVGIPGLVVKRSIAPRQGKILTVNRRYDFVVISLGERDGIEPGNRFRVIDREKVVGELVARRVEANLTVADVQPETTRRRLRQDLVVITNE